MWQNCYTSGLGALSYLSVSRCVHKERDASEPSRHRRIPVYLMERPLVRPSAGRLRAILRVRHGFNLSNGGCNPRFASRKCQRPVTTLKEIEESIHDQSDRRCGAAGFSFFRGKGALWSRLALSNRPANRSCGRYQVNRGHRKGRANWSLVTHNVTSAKQCGVGGPLPPCLTKTLLARRRAFLGPCSIAVPLTSSLAFAPI